MIYYDIYVEAAVADATPAGPDPGQIYARVPAYDPETGAMLTYLCRVTEAQLLYFDEQAIAYATWDTVDLKGARKALKVKIKDKAAKDKDIPTVAFGGDLHSPGCAPLTTGAEVDSTDKIKHPVASVREAQGDAVDPT